MALETDLLESWWLDNNFFGAKGAYNGNGNNVTFDSINQKVGSACGIFNGVNGWVSVPSINGTLINGSVSGAIWINLDNLSAFDTFLSLGDGSASGTGFQLDESNTAGGLRIFLYGNTGSTATVTVANALLGLETTWVLAGFTLDIDANLLSLYKNGFPIGSVATAVEGIENGANGLNIGNLRNIRYMDGLGDAPALINGAWSDADHLEYWNAGAGIQIPVAAPSFNPSWARNSNQIIGSGILT